MFHLTKKRAVVMAVVGSLALSVGAYAYFSAAGTGTGSATTGSASTVTITKTNTTPPLYPGTAQPVNLDITNVGAGTQLVRLVHLESVSTDKGQACDVNAFTMADVPINARMTAGEVTSKTGSLAMSDTDVDQNGCQGAVLTLTFSSN